MFGLYTKKEVSRLVRRLRDEYDEALRQQKSAAEELKENNRQLAARVLEMESERGNVSAALIRAVEEGERIKRESAASADGERAELALLAEKCRLLLKTLTAKYPDSEDVREFSAFVEDLRARFGDTREEDGVLDMEEVLAPKQPLDLGKLCKDLGLMEEDG